MPSPPPPPSACGDLDLRGEVCPYTFVRTRLALEAMAVGARIRIGFDHAPAVTNLPRSLREWGQEVVEVTAVGPGQWTLEVVKRVE